jgi:hypothetical protein
MGHTQRERERERERDDKTNLCLNTTVFHKGPSISSKTTHGTPNVLIYFHNFLHTAGLLRTTPKKQTYKKLEQNAEHKSNHQRKKKKHHYFSEF